MVLALRQCASAPEDPFGPAPRRSLRPGCCSPLRETRPSMPGLSISLIGAAPFVSARLSVAAAQALGLDRVPVHEGLSPQVVLLGRHRRKHQAAQFQRIFTAPEERLPGTPKKGERGFRKGPSATGRALRRDRPGVMETISVFLLRRSASQNMSRRERVDGTLHYKKPVGAPSFDPVKTAPLFIAAAPGYAITRYIKFFPRSV
jgi:hypothetical protein